MTRTLSLKPYVLLELGDGSDNTHILAMKSQRSYPAVRSFVTASVRRIDLDVLASVLTNGAGLTEEQVLDLRLGDLFEFVNLGRPGKGDQEKESKSDT